MHPVNAVRRGYVDVSSLASCSVFEQPTVGLAGIPASGAGQLQAVRHDQTARPEFLQHVLVDWVAVGGGGECCQVVGLDALLGERCASTLTAESSIATGP